MDWETVEKRYKTFNDAIHGSIHMNELCLEFIDTKQFQRLRDLKQLGTLSYIFPCATHTRFEHSLGVGYLSGNIVNRYKIIQPELQISNREVNLIKIAGLLHDIGHGPFSHVFDNVFMKAINNNSSYCHENMSIKMIDYLIDDNNIDIENDDINFIKNIITNKKIKYNNYLQEIVANGINCLDVDKFDYLSRDMHNLFGTYKSYNFKRIYEFNKVIDNTICYDSKVIFDIYELFRERYNMHRQIYNHKKGKAIEYMVSDIMINSNKLFKFSDTVNNPEDFLKITDNVIKKVEYNDNPQLIYSQSIIQRIYNRKLYEFIDEFIVPIELMDKIPKIKETDISTNNICSSININPDDIIIYDNRLNYNLNNNNPVDNVYFYNASDTDVKFKKNKKDTSSLLPTNYEDRVLRIYSRNLDINVNYAIKQAFNKFIKQF